MPRQPEVHFRLKPADENGKSIIYLQFLYNKNRLFFSFGQSVKSGDWNKDKQRVKKKDTTTADGKFALNALLDNLKKVCEKTYNESLKDGIPKPEKIKEALKAFIDQNHSDKTGPTLYSLAERFVAGEIKNKGKEKSKGSLQNYSAVMKHLKNFEAKTKYKIDFDTITLDFFYKYTSYLKNVEKLAVNTIAKDISILKVFMGEAVDLGYTTNMQFRHNKFSFSEVETDQVYLSEKELNDLYKFEITNNKLQQVRDLFIFGAWVGLRFSDFSNIKPENIVQIEGDSFIKIITKKTKELVIIPCNPVVLEIFEKYSHNANKLPKTISNQKFNTYIKEVCEMAGLAETGRLSNNPEEPLYNVISSHTARRSFATNYYLQGFPTLDLMKITGHRTEKAFLKYIRVSKLDAAKRLSAHMKKRWSEKILRVA
ncbi:MAG TPA: site-specific integrase [Hanamia sp.]